MWRALEEKCEKSAKGGEAKISCRKRHVVSTQFNHTYSTTQQFSTWEFNLRIETHHPRKKVENYSHAHLNEFVVIKEYLRSF
jgi:hypothetical protein